MLQCCEKVICGFWTVLGLELQPPHHSRINYNTFIFSFIPNSHSGTNSVSCSTGSSSLCIDPSIELFYLLLFVSDLKAVGEKQDISCTKTVVL